MTAGIEAFRAARIEAAKAHVRGDSGPLDRIVADRDPATFFGPMGGSVTGAASVTARYDKDALSFGAGGTTDLTALHHGQSGDLAYWVGFQEAEAHMDGRREPVLMRLRVTEIFRREDGAWKLIHRHADTLTEARHPRG